jgi:hypothetical protein
MTTRGKNHRPKDIVARLQNVDAILNADQYLAAVLQVDRGRHRDTQHGFGDLAAASTTARTRSSRSSGSSITAPVANQSVTVPLSTTSKREDTTGAARRVGASPAHFRRQYHNVGTVTRSRVQNRAAFSPAFSERCSRCCHSASFRRSFRRVIASLLRFGVNKVNPRGYLGPVKTGCGGRTRIWNIGLKPAGESRRAPPVTGDHFPEPSVGVAHIVGVEDARRRVSRLLRLLLVVLQHLVDPRRVLPQHRLRLPPELPTSLCFSTGVHTPVVAGVKVKGIGRTDTFYPATGIGFWPAMITCAASNSASL